MWNLEDTQLLLQQTGTDKDLGLDSREAQRRLTADGFNQLREEEKKPLWKAFLEQINDPLIYVLLAAGVISLLLHEAADAAVILAVVLLNAVVGLMQETRAQKALDALKKLSGPHARVIRDGKQMQIPASMLVKGDLVCLEAGMQVPADIRLLSVWDFMTEESALTGESIPVQKNTQYRDTTIIGDRTYMAYMSTTVAGGRGIGVVTATGMDTEVGKIADMIAENESEPTPLQLRLEELGKVLSLLSLGVCAALFVIAILQQRPLMSMLLTAISLAVAAVPEGLAAVVTLCLALSVTRMVKAGTIVRRLPCVETLGSVNVVCSDKTGTLTQNRMTVMECMADAEWIPLHKLTLSGHEELFWGMVLCCDAVLDQEEGVGDPTELALLEFGAKYGIDKTELEKKMPRIQEKAFDSRRKMMSTQHLLHGEAVTYTKGAPEVILPKCSYICRNGKKEPLTENMRRQIQKEAQNMAAKALRTLALAYKPEKEGEIGEQDMIFSGMVGMADPIRPEAKEAVAVMKNAGVRTVMITGDHMQTALAVARNLGIAEKQKQCMTGEELERLTEQERKDRLADIRVFARVSPAHKVSIVKALQKAGNVVAMTGDGVNDAPSLKAADVGVAMGKNGTDVARQAADLILTDDNFNTIRKTMQEGRSVYENIRKSVIFLLSSNLGEILTMFTAVLCMFPAPLKSSHILWINLITDSLPALALGVDKNDENSLMNRPPKEAGESLFSEGGLSTTILYGVLIAALSLGAYCMVPAQILHAHGKLITPQHIADLLQQETVLFKAQTYAFTVLGLSQLFHAVGMRDMKKSVFAMKHLENRLMLAAFLAGFCLQVMVTEIPFFIRVFQTAALTGREWLVLTAVSMIPVVLHELLVKSDSPSSV